MADHSTGSWFIVTCGCYTSRTQAGVRDAGKFQGCRADKLSSCRRVAKQLCPFVGRSSKEFCFQGGVYFEQYFSFYAEKKVSLHRHDNPWPFRLSWKTIWMSLKFNLIFFLLEWRSPVLDLYIGLSSFSPAPKTKIRTECIQLPISVVRLITSTLGQFARESPSW